MRKKQQKSSWSLQRFEWYRILRLLPVWLVGLLFIYWVGRSCRELSTWHGRLILGTRLDGRCMFYAAGVYMGVFLCGDIGKRIIGKMLSIGYSRKQIFWIKLLNFYLICAFWAMLFLGTLLFLREPEWETVLSP